MIDSRDADALNSNLNSSIHLWDTWRTSTKDSLFNVWRT